MKTIDLKDMAGTLCDVALNFYWYMERAGSCFMFVSFDTFSGSWHGR